MMAFVLGLFIVCYLPYAILAPLKHHYGGYPLRVARDVAMVLCMCNSCMNSIIYGAINFDFRCAYYQLLGCKGWQGNSNGVLVIDAARYLDNDADAWSCASVGSNGRVGDANSLVATATVPIMRCYTQSARSVNAEPPTDPINTRSSDTSQGYSEPPTLPDVVD